MVLSRVSDIPEKCSSVKRKRCQGISVLQAVSPMQHLREYYLPTAKSRLRKRRAPVLWNLELKMGLPQRAKLDHM